jgi:hypothetical protein
VALMERTSCLVGGSILTRTIRVGRARMSMPADADAGVLPDCSEIASTSSIRSEGVSAMATVAIVHSTAYGDNNKGCFDAGMADALQGSGVPKPATPDYPARGDYSKLQQRVRDALQGPPSADLIVAAGGVIAANAAAAVLTHPNDKPYIF